MIPLCWSTCISDGNALSTHLTHIQSLFHSFFLSFSISITLTLTLSTASFIGGVKACDFNHSFYSLVNTVWLGFCVLVLYHEIRHTLYKIVRKYNTPLCKARKNNFHRVLSALKSLPHTLTSSLGLPFLDTIFPSRWPALLILLLPHTPLISTKKKHLHA